MDMKQISRDEGCNKEEEDIKPIINSLLDVKSGYDDWKIAPLIKTELDIKEEFIPEIAEISSTDDETTENGFKCEFCSLLMCNESDFKRHLEIHTGEKPFKCKSESEDDLKCYNFLQNPEESFIKEKLDETNEIIFKIQQEFEGIKNKISDIPTPKKNQFQCPECDYKTWYKCNFTRHIREHTGEKPFKCNICDYKAFRKIYLDYHMKSHSGEKSYECVMCPFKSVQRSGLTRHMKLHSGEKPYKCNVCAYRTAQKSHLANHMRTHVAEKLFLCDRCGHNTTTISSLRQHSKIHNRINVYECNICDYRTFRKSNFQQHMATHSGEVD